MKKKGLVLIVTLWLITIMSIFGIGLARISWSGYRFAKFRTDGFLSLSAINSLVAMSKLNRLDDLTSGYDTMSELPEEAEYESNNLKIIYSLIDEERKININRASSLILKKLPDMDMDKAVAIVNSKFKPFRIKEELLLIDEIDEEDYVKIKDLITVHGQGGVNINTSSQDILEALGMEQSLLTRIMNFRKGEDGELYTEDDGWFESRGTIIDSLREKFYLSLTEEQTLVSLISKNILGVQSDNYQIKACVYANDKLVDRYSIVFGKEEGLNRYSIKEWTQD